MSLTLLVYPQVKRCVCVPEGRPEISRRRSPSVTTGNAATEACAPWKGAGTALALLRILVRRPCRDAKSVLSGSSGFAVRHDNCSDTINKESAEGSSPLADDEILTYSGRDLPNKCRFRRSMPGRDIIVIGTSAGGVEALVELARGLPPD